MLILYTDLRLVTKEVSSLHVVFVVKVLLSRDTGELLRGLGIPHESWLPVVGGIVGAVSVPLLASCSTFICICQRVSWVHTRGTAWSHFADSASSPPSAPMNFGGLGSGGTAPSAPVPQRRYPPCGRLRRCAGTAAVRRRLISWVRCCWAAENVFKDAQWAVAPGPVQRFLVFSPPGLNVAIHFNVGRASSAGCRPL